MPWYTWSMRKGVSGFTIVELLVVIVVIAILASISTVAYTGLQTRARVSAMVSGINATEKAFNLYKATGGSSTWWRENDASLLSGGSSAITSIIANNDDFRDYLKEAPTTSGLGTSSQWYYDNDGDTNTGCSTIAGVNIYATYATADFVQVIDDAIDDGNLSCGKVRFYTTGNWLVYSLASSETQ